MCFSERIGMNNISKTIIYFLIVTIVNFQLYAFDNNKWHIHDSNLLSGKNTVFQGIPEQLKIKEGPNSDEIFLKFNTTGKSSIHHIPLGKINNMSQFAGCYRHTSCWMSPATGTKVSGIPLETQYLLVKQDERYIILIPLIDGPARMSLFGDKNEQLVLRIETGAKGVRVDKFAGLYMISGNNPYKMMEQAAQTLAGRYDTLMLRTEKKEPDYVDYLGWCSWNAFYSKVSYEKLMEALRFLDDKGIAPGFIILDDGWQSGDENKELISFEANEKFPGLKKTIRQVKQKYGVHRFLLWQTFLGYWRGVDQESFSNLNIDLTKPHRPQEVVSLEKSISYGESFVPGFNISMPEFAPFYDAYHSYMSKQGVDGVKIDAIAWIQAYSHNKGGRVESMSRLMEAVEHSAKTYFENNVLNCSACSNDFIFNSRSTAVMRSSSDFFPKKLETHGYHIFTNAHTSFWLGWFMLPDWDMFQSGHKAGDFHAAARAVSGGPVYSTDELGKENPKILKRLCFSNRKVPQCITPARVCLDSFFVDPLKDEQLIKIFNHNKYGGVLGLFNCCYRPEKEDFKIEGTAEVDDIYDLKGEAFAVYHFNSKKLSKMSRNDNEKFNLSELDYELLTFMPIKNGFAPIGLTNLYNSAGAIESVNYNNQQVTVGLLDGGRFVAYSQDEPQKVMINDKSADYKYKKASLKLIIDIKPGKAARVSIKW